MTRRAVSPAASAVRIVGVAAVYFGAARLGLSMAFVAEQVTLIWPPTGIALSALLLLGPHAWIGVWLGAWAANASIGEPWATAAGIATGNTVAAAAGAWLLRRAGFSPSLERLWDVMALLGLAAAGATVISATVGASSLCLSGLHPWSSFGSLWWTWWLGDAMGVVLTAPVLLTFAARPRLRWPAGQVAEAAVLLGGLTAVALVVFAVRLPAVPGSHEPAWAVFPFVIWVALRFGPRETAAALLLIAAVAIGGTVSGHGPFAGPATHQSLVLLQVFMAVVAGTALVLAAATAERRTAERRRSADYAVTQILAEASTLEAAAPRILQAICQSLEWDLGALWTVDAAAGGLRCREVWHKPNVRAPRFTALTRERTFVPGEGLPGRVWSRHEPVWISDVVRDANFPRAELAAGERLHGAFGFPLMLGDEVLGVIEFFSREIRQPDADLLHMFATVGGQFGQFIDRRRVERERGELVAELRQAAQAKDQFLAALGHELRNPLAPLRNALELLRGSGAADPLSRRMQDVMDRQLRHLVRLVDDLLDVSRITRGRIDLRKERVELASVLERAVEAARPALDERRHALDLTLPSEPLRLEADPTRLEQVVTNLLQNAARYTEAGGRITLAASRQGDEAVITVRDNGIGIRPEMLNRIFEAFVQADRSPHRAPEGLGIGLTLVKNLVQMHQGTVQAASGGSGRGSEFTVRLPLAAAGEPAVPRPPPAAAPPAAEPADAAPTATRRRVLVVDDNIDGAESVALLLSHAGYEVATAHDGLSALEQARAAPFDVVLLDIGLPEGLDGYEVARRLRAEAASRGAVLIAITGFGQEEDRRRALAAGFDRHLVKPVDPEQLRRLLASV